MFRHSKTSAACVIAAGGIILLSSPVIAQWLKYPTAGVPRTAAGTVNMTAPTPRTSAGKPDFSGLWLTNRPFCPTGLEPDSVLCGLELPMGLDGINIGASLPGGLPYQPWLAALVKERTLPHLLKFVQTPALLVMLSEVNASYRQVFLDGRPLPRDPTPSWQGYSSAKWDGDTLVIDSIGFRDHLWIDWNGSELTEAAKVRERIRRPDYGHLEIELAVDDPKAYTRPWTVKLTQRIVVDPELVDEICLENEKSAQRMK